VSASAGEPLLPVGGMRRLTSNETKTEQHVYTSFITPAAIFDMRTGSLKSGHRFIQMIYRLPDIVYTRCVSVVLENKKKKISFNIPNLHNDNMP